MKRSHLNSQNFIRRPELVRKLLSRSNIKKSDTVYDIGAGSGIISSELARICKHVVAVELDSRMAAKLRENMTRYTNVTILEADFLGLELPTTGYKVFANIPFHLSSPILRKLSGSQNPPSATYLIVQRQFARKLIVGEASAFTGLLGALIAPWFQARVRAKLERTDFSPQPAVDTAMVEILRRDTSLLDWTHKPAYDAFVTHCYDRQKFFSTLPATLTKDKRPSQLTAEEWVTLFQASKSA